MRNLLTISTIVLKEKKDIVYTTIFGVLAGLIGISLFGASGYVISKAALIPPLYTLTVMLALLKLFGIAKAVTKYAERYYSHRATFTILGNLRVRFFEKLEPLMPSVLHQYRSGDLLARIVGDVENLQNFFLRVFYPPIVFFFVFISTIFFTLFYSVWISVTLAIGMLLTGGVVPMLAAWRQQRLKASTQELRSELSAETTEFLYGFRDLKVHQKVGEKQGKLTELSKRYLSAQARKQEAENASQSWSLVISMFVCWAVTLFGVYDVTRGELDGLFLAMLIMIGLNVFEYAVPMAAFPTHFEDSRRSSAQLFSVMGNQKEVKKRVSAVLQDEPMDVEVRNLSFAYGNRNVLDDVSVTFSAGSKTAIVGPSGSGKSTLFQLLVKLYEPTSGTISINQEFLTNVEQEDLWSYTNVVMQENHFFYGTVRDNLLLANDNASDIELKAALQAVELHAYELDDRILEKGENLSGGERQKLAMARAFLKKGRVWLLDEPFSSMDLLTEQKVIAELTQKAKDATLIFISHRLAGLERMDQIIVMDEGRVVEVGSFSELMSKKGYFYHLKQVEKSILFS